MNEFPTKEDEFELMYGDELDLLNELPDFNPVVRKTPKSIDSSLIQHNSNKENDYSIANSSQSQDLFPTQLSLSKSDKTTQRCVTNTHNDEEIPSRKRTIQELFGDIDDLLNEHNNGTQMKKHRGDGNNEDDNDRDFALIEQIVTLRKLNRKRDNPILRRKDQTNPDERNKCNLSFRVPRYPFISVTRHDNERIYVRCHSEDYEREEMMRITKEINRGGVLGQNFQEIWSEANEIINKKLNGDDVKMKAPNSEVMVVGKELWVDLYKPRKYPELLSDESTNRVLLKWLKLWDKIVFQRVPKIKALANRNSDSSKVKDLVLELDQDGRPYYKVALLCGAPGLGKTTLAHMVARHCGYNIVEINASDDRSVEFFRNNLENATQMRSVLDAKRRPNCLIFDEIDGAPQSSIDYLVKFATNPRNTKAKSSKKDGKFLKRPVICICNDLYVPALRPLRQIAFVVNFPQTSSVRLSERLMEISRRQAIKTDNGAMLALAEKSHNDIRSCLSVLHYFKAQNEPVTLTQIYKSAVGQKDMHQGLFSVWQTIFQIDRPKIKAGTDERLQMSTKERMEKILKVVNSFGDYERIANGVFENFPLLNAKRPTLEAICHASDWFCHFDIMNNQMRSRQNYSLLPYLPYGFVVWHYTFASNLWQKLQYPNASYEAKVKKDRRKGIVREVINGMAPTIRVFVQPVSLILNILPMISLIISPTFRPVNLHLFTKEEKEVLKHVVDVMVDYNLNYVQERTPDGAYPFKLDPNIDEVVSFPKQGVGKLQTLSHMTRQLIAHEVDLARMRRFERHRDVGSTPKSLKTEVVAKKVANHLQTLNLRSAKTPSKPIVVKDFFGRIIKSPSSSADGAKKSSPSLPGSGKDPKHDIWFKYKEGYNNAVRKIITISSLK